MKQVHMQLRIVKDKFPMQDEHIETLYEQNPDFRTLCLDYYYCLQSLEKMQGEFREKLDSIREFETVRHDLEKELQAFLSEYKI